MLLRQAELNRHAMAYSTFEQHPPNIKAGANTDAAIVTEPETIVEQIESNCNSWANREAVRHRSYPNAERGTLRNDVRGDSM